MDREKIKTNLTKVVETIVDAMFEFTEDLDKPQNEPFVLSEVVLTNGNTYPEGATIHRVVQKVDDTLVDTRMVRDADGNMIKKYRVDRDNNITHMAGEETH